MLCERHPLRNRVACGMPLKHFVVGSSAIAAFLSDRPLRSADSSKERPHVTPDVGAGELPAIVEQPLTSHAVVEAQRRIAEFRKENECVDIAVQESSRRLCHHAPAEAQPVVLPAEIDLAQLTG